MPHNKSLIRQVDLLTVAALSLEQIFTMEALAVQSWKLWPHLFCIKGFVEYPDNNRAICFVTHKRQGTVGRQYMARITPGRYSLTEKGKSHAKDILEQLQSGHARVRQPQATIEVDVEVSS